MLRTTDGVPLHRIRRSLLALVCAAAIVLVAVASLPPVQTASAQTRTVRVACYYDGSYLYSDGQGAFKGYDVEYLYELAHYTGWNYEFVDYGTWDDAVAAVESGEADLIPAFFYSEERAERFLFSSSDMGSVYVTLITRPDDTTHAYDDAVSFEGERVGVLGGSLDADAWRSWITDAGVHTETVEYDSVEAMLLALDEGDLDAVAVTNLGNGYHYRVVARFHPFAMYIASGRTDTELMRQLDAGMEDLAVQEPYFTQNLYDRYFGIISQQATVLTQTEQDYVASAGTLRVAMLENDAPYSTVAADGTATGIIPDVLQMVAAKSGLSFEVVPCSTQDEEISAVRSGAVDFIAGIDGDSFFAADNGLRMTNSYMIIALAQVTRAGATTPQTVAMPSFIVPVYQCDLLRGSNQYSQVKYFKTSAQCLAALDAGLVDAVLTDSAAANYLVSQRNMADYSVVTMSSSTYEISMALSETADQRLYSTLNSCISSIGSADVDASVVRNSTDRGSWSLNQLITRIPLSALFTLACVACLIALLLVLAVVTLVRRGREEKRLAHERDEAREREAHLREAEQASREKARFFSNMSHDMRTPLNGIVGFTGLGLAAEDLDSAKDCLGKIQLSSNLLLDLVNDTLTLSKIENGKLALRAEPLLPSRLIRNVTVPIRSSAEARGVSFICDTRAMVDSPILADRLSLEKILLNLLSNAVKFTPEGGTVTLRVETLDPPLTGMNTRVTVSDTGIGIEPDFITKIFDPFEQANPHGMEGTGLGLSIVSKLVRMLGGTIDVTSTPGEGTTFVVLMPLVPATDTPAAPDAGGIADAPDDGSAAEGGMHRDGTDADDADRDGAGMQATGVEPDLTGLHVLLCEDNALNAEIARRLLESRGIEMTRAADGLEGVHRFEASEEGTFDLVLMDLRMPVLDGVNAARALRALDRDDARTVPIVSMTADAYEDDVDRCCEAGMDGHVGKPVDPARLFAEIARLCGR